MGESCYLGTYLTSICPRWCAVIYCYVFSIAGSLKQNREAPIWGHGDVDCLPT